MLEVDSVAISFKGRAILSGCYLNCKKGEIVGLLGRNGCGKSTLLKIIFGSLKADFKHLRIDDTIVHRGYRSRQVAYLPQDNFFPPFLKVNDVLQSLESEQVNRLMEIEVFHTIADKKIVQLSGGELRMLECAWVLSRPANYILLDEPFMGISPVYIEQLQQLIRETGKQKGIILTDHIYRPLLEISDRIVLLHNNSVYRIDDESDLIRYQYIPDFS